MWFPLSQASKEGSKRAQSEGRWGHMACLRAGPGGPFYCPSGQGVVTHGPATQDGGFHSLQLVPRERH